MSITRNDPDTIFLAGERTQVNDYAVSEAVAPGHLIERFNNAGVWRYRKHTATSKEGSTYATEHAMANKGVGDSYAANDLVEASIGHKGSGFWAWLASGQSVVFGNTLESAGNGMLKVHSSGVQIATALETRNNSTGSLAPSTLPTGVAAGACRIRVEVL